MARSAASIAETANYYRQNIAIAEGERAWLYTEHLKIPTPLSHKLSAHFVIQFPLLYAITPVSF